MDRRYTSHLNRGLDANGKEEAAEGRSVGEQLFVGLGLVVMLERNHVLDLVVLSNDPGIRSVAVRVQLCERTKAFLGVAVIDQPSGLC